MKKGNQITVSSDAFDAVILDLDNFCILYNMDVLRKVQSIAFE